MTTHTLNPTDSLQSLDLHDGDALTAAMHAGQLILSVHSAREIAELEESLDASRAKSPIPLEPDFFDRMREKARHAAKS